MKYAINFGMAIVTGIAMGWIGSCAPTTHVTETTTTRAYDTKAPLMAPVSTTNTTTTTQYDNGTVQRTVTQPGPYAQPEQSKSTTVTTDTNNGNVQKRTTTTYTSPYSTP